VAFIPVLFEDHTWRNFRPVALGAPVYELRCGAFNTRERAELAGATGGVLLCRPWLEELHTCEGWRKGMPAAKELAAEGGRLLLLSGRLPAATEMMRVLLALADEDFVWRDEAGLLAASVGGPAAAAALAGWEAWSAGGDEGVFAWEPPAEWARGDAAPVAAARPEVAAALAELINGTGAAPRWVWDLVGATAAAGAADAAAQPGRATPGRRPFGLVPAEPEGADWRRPARWAALSGAPAAAFPVLAADDVEVHPSAALDCSQGPILLDRGCRIGPHTSLEGPLYLGPGSRVKAGAAIYGESSFGIGNRLAGEIGESTFGDFANKQHDGFIGHAVCGAWINLGAMTTCSDLKNNYGEVRVDLGDGELATGRRFVGLMLADHVKTAIGSLFNTGTVVGYATNIFGGGMPPKHVGSFSWGGAAGAPAYAVDRAVDTARIVMSRRGCSFTGAHEALFRRLADG
jgi:hypothetical protein